MTRPLKASPLTDKPVAWRQYIGGRWCYFDGPMDPREVHDNGKPCEPLIVAGAARDEAEVLRRILRAACSTLESSHAMAMASGQVQKWRKDDTARSTGEGETK